MVSDTYTLTISDVGVSTPADGSVTTAKIVDLNVTTGKIADSAITSAKIANGTITGTDIASGTITSSNILDGTITGTDIATGTVTSSNIVDGTIVAGDIAADAVTTAKILNSNVTTLKIADNNVTVGKIQQVGANKILGNSTGSTANLAEKDCSTLAFTLLANTSQASMQSTLGLGTMSTQAASAVAITGGTISGVTYSGTSVNVSSPTGTLPAVNGGTGLNSYAAGDLLYATGSASLAKLTKGSDATTVLHASGSGSTPTWSKIDLANDVTGYLPIANGGTGGPTVDTLSFATTGLTTDALATGEIRWNTTDQTLDLKLAGDVTLQMGQECNLYVHNEDSVLIPNGSAVYIYGANGSNPSVKRATNSDITGKKVLGIATQDIAIGGDGYITTQGLVRDINTSTYGGVGSPLYLGTSGALTSTMPAYPNTAARVAVVVTNNSSTGIIYVHSPVLIDNIVVGQFTWSGNVTTGPTQTVTGLTSSANVIIQERNTTSPLSKSYSVVCNTGTFVPYCDASASMNGKLFSYIAFL
jgi:hypothetical protein